MKADTVACRPSSHSRRMAAIRKLRFTFPRTSFDDAKPHPRARSIPATLPARRTSHALRCWILQRQKTSTIRTRGMTADQDRFLKMVILALQELWARMGQLAWSLSGLLLLAGLTGVVFLFRWIW